MKWKYKLTTNTIWASFDYGEVTADTREEAIIKAKREIQTAIGKIDKVLSQNPETKDFVIEMDYDQIEVEPLPELKAKLVYFNLVTRVVVPEDWEDGDIVDAAYGGILAKINNNELYENLEKIVDDIEFPASKEDGECYPEI